MKGITMDEAAETLKGNNGSEPVPVPAKAEEKESKRLSGKVYDKATVKKFLAATPLIERAMVNAGIILLKYWLEVSEEEQTRRLTDRIEDGRKIWKLSPMDLKSYSKWYDYSRARDDMFAATDTS